MVVLNREGHGSCNTLEGQRVGDGGVLGSHVNVLRGGSGSDPLACRQSVSLGNELGVSRCISICLGLAREELTAYRIIGNKVDLLNNRNDLCGACGHGHGIADSGNVDLLSVCIQEVDLVDILTVGLGQCGADGENGCVFGNHQARDVCKHACNVSGAVGELRGNEILIEDHVLGEVRREDLNANAGGNNAVHRNVHAVFDHVNDRLLLLVLLDCVCEINGYAHCRCKVIGEGYVVDIEVEVVTLVGGVGVMLGLKCNRLAAGNRCADGSANACSLRELVDQSRIHLHGNAVAVDHKAFGASDRVCAQGELQTVLCALDGYGVVAVCVLLDGNGGAVSGNEELASCLQLIVEVIDNVCGNGSCQDLCGSDHCSVCGCNRPDEVEDTVVESKSLCGGYGGNCGYALIPLYLIAPEVCSALIAEGYGVNPGLVNRTEDRVTLDREDLVAVYVCPVQEGLAVNNRSVQVRSGIHAVGQEDLIEGVALSILIGYLGKALEVERQAHTERNLEVGDHACNHALKSLVEIYLAEQLVYSLLQVSTNVHRENGGLCREASVAVVESQDRACEDLAEHRLGNELLNQLLSRGGGNEVGIQHVQSEVANTVEVLLVSCRLFQRQLIELVCIVVLKDLEEVEANLLCNEGCNRLERIDALVIVNDLGQRVIVQESSDIRNAGQLVQIGLNGCVAVCIGGCLLQDRDNVNLYLACQRVADRLSGGSSVCDLIENSVKILNGCKVELVARESVDLFQSKLHVADVENTVVNCGNVDTGKKCKDLIQGQARKICEDLLTGLACKSKNLNQNLLALLGGEVALVCLGNGCGEIDLHAQHIAVLIDADVLLNLFDELNDGSEVSLDHELKVDVLNSGLLVNVLVLCVEINRKDLSVGAVLQLADGGDHRNDRLEQRLGVEGEKSCVVARGKLSGNCIAVQRNEVDVLNQRGCNGKEDILDLALAQLLCERERVGLELIDQNVSVDQTHESGILGLGDRRDELIDVHDALQGNRAGLDQSEHGIEVGSLVAKEALQTLLGHQIGNRSFTNKQSHQGVAVNNRGIVNCHPVDVLHHDRGYAGLIEGNVAVLQIVEQVDSTCLRNVQQCELNCNLVVIGGVEEAQRQAADKAIDHTVDRTLLEINGGSVVLDIRLCLALEELGDLRVVRIEECICKEVAVCIYESRKIVARKCLCEILKLAVLEVCCREGVAVDGTNDRVLYLCNACCGEVICIVTLDQSDQIVRNLGMLTKLLKVDRLLKRDHVLLEHIRKQIVAVYNLFQVCGISANQGKDLLVGEALHLLLEHRVVCILICNREVPLNVQVDDVLCIEQRNCVLKSQNEVDQIRLIRREEKLLFVDELHHRLKTAELSNQRGSLFVVGSEERVCDGIHGNHLDQVTQNDDVCLGTRDRILDQIDHGVKASVCLERRQDLSSVNLQCNRSVGTRAQNGRTRLGDRRTSGNGGAGRSGGISCKCSNRESRKQHYERKHHGKNSSSHLVYLAFLIDFVPIGQWIDGIRLRRFFSEAMPKKQNVSQKGYSTPIHVISYH